MEKGILSVYFLFLLSFGSLWLKMLYFRSLGCYIALSSLNWQFLNLWGWID